MKLDRSKVIRAREMLGYGVEKTAEEAGVSKNSVLRAEHEEDIRPVTARKIAAALGVRVADLIGESETLKVQPPLPNFNGERSGYNYEPARKALDGFCAHWEVRLRAGNFDQEALDEFEVAVRGFAPALHAAVAAEDAERPPRRPGGETFDESVLWPAVERLIFLGVDVATACPKAEITDLRDYFPRAG